MDLDSAAVFTDTDICAICPCFAVYNVPGGLLPVQGKGCIFQDMPDKSDEKYPVLSVYSWPNTFFSVKWALDPHQRFVADMEIYFRGFRIAMSKQGLDMLPGLLPVPSNVLQSCGAGCVELPLQKVQHLNTARRITCSSVLTVR